MDSYIKNLWLWIQSQDYYKNKTTMIITTDHGRGKYLNDKWGSHGASVPNAQNVWVAIIGPDTPPKGEIVDSKTIYTNQIAATIAYLLGFDYKTNRKHGPVIREMISN